MGRKFKRPDPNKFVQIVYANPEAWYWDAIHGIFEVRDCLNIKDGDCYELVSDLKKTLEKKHCIDFVIPTLETTCFYRT